MLREGRLMFVLFVLWTVIVGIICAFRTWVTVVGWMV